MKLLKYPSIENHYDSRNINRWLHYHPELETEFYTIEEKCHGSNIQFIFTPNDKLRLASRNRILGDGENFYDIFNVIEKYREFIDAFQSISNALNASYNFYGEIFGSNIQKGVDYGPEKQILFFGARVNGLWVSASTFYTMMKENNFSELIIPILGKADCLEDALEFKADVPSMILNKEDNIMEGVVIKPMFKVYESPEGEMFYLKKKNEKFLEKSKEPKVFVPSHPLKEEFLKYINDNRLDGIFSKYGKIDRPQQIGEYIKYMLEDAKEDFLKENSIEGLSKNEIKEIFSAGYDVMRLLKGVLKDD